MEANLFCNHANETHKVLDSRSSYMGHFYRGKRPVTLPSIPEVQCKCTIKMVQVVNGHGYKEKNEGRVHGI